MATVLKYMTDEKGDRTSVIVPIKKWQKINNDYAKLQNKLFVLTGIAEGFTEIERANKNGMQLQSLNDFLHECNR